VPFYSERTTIDMLGLTDKHLAHLPGDYDQKVDPQYILSRKPDIVIFTSHVLYSKNLNPEGLATGGGLYPYKPFQQSYKYLRSYTYLEGYYLLVYVKEDSNNILPQFFKTATVQEN
jgi:hypothetical protein